MRIVIDRCLAAYGMFGLQRPQFVVWMPTPLPGSMKRFNFRCDENIGML